MRVLPPVLALSLSLVLGGEVRAQETSTTDLESELRMMVAEPTAADLDRQTVRDFLERDDVREAVETSGMDAERLEARVATLEGEKLTELAERVRSMEQDGDLVGGSTIVISSTTLIIILLILILVT